MRIPMIPVLLCTLAALLHGADPLNRPLVDLGALDLATLTCKSATVAHSGSAEAPALRVTVQAQGVWPGVVIPAPGGAWDLSKLSYLTLDVRNLDDHDIDVFVRVDNPGANGHDHCMTERIGTQPDQRVTITVPIKRVSTSTIKLFGMHGFPQGMYASGGIDPANIVALTIFTENKPTVSHTFEISGIRAFGAYEEPPWTAMSAEQFFPCIDRFGQFRHKDWPGKTRDEAELAGAREREAAALAAAGAPAEWDAWGGWANGPLLEATGHFRTAKHAGKWWLVDPDGRLFFSVGPTCVRTDFGTTMLDDREHWFADLPADAADPLAVFRFRHGKAWGGGYYGGKTPMAYNFSAANLSRKYGSEWKTVYPSVVHDRMRAWGLNTVANWSDGAYAGPGQPAGKRTPYTRTFFYESPRLKADAVPFPDMLDPGFAKALDKGAAKFLSGTADDPWCLGYFLDNEMPWGGEDTLARYALASPAKQAAKQALVAWLKERHAGIAELNTAWGTAVASWEALAADTAVKPKAGAQADLIAFTGVMAEAYFREVKAAIRRFAPHKLYLGCRCVGGSSNVIAAAVRHCDVVSYNRYCASVRDIRLPDGHDAPVIIGEFHFGGLDRGPFWAGLFSADDQEDRARKFTAYVRSALDNPQIIGVHWFQYGDEPATGRVDGENAQCGFVDICDTPYVETIAAARASAETMYRIRLDGK